MLLQIVQVFTLQHEVVNFRASRENWRTQKKAVEAFSSSRKITDSFKKSTTKASKKLKEFDIKFSVLTACHCSVRSANHQTEFLLSMEREASLRMLNFIGQSYVLDQERNIFGPI